MAAQIPTNGLNVDAGLDIAGGNLTFTTADKGVHLVVTFKRMLLFHQTVILLVLQ